MIANTKHHFLNKPRRKRNSPEYDLQCQIADTLDTILNPHFTCWSSVENSNHTGGISGCIKQGKDKRKGVKAGVPDLFILYNGTCLWIELKAGKNGTTESQDSFHRKVVSSGNRIEVVMSHDELLFLLEKHHVPTLIKG